MLSNSKSTYINIDLVVSVEGYLMLHSRASSWMLGFTYCSVRDGALIRVSEELFETLISNIIFDLYPYSDCYEIIHKDRISNLSAIDSIGGVN